MHSDMSQWTSIDNLLLVEMMTSNNHILADQVHMMSRSFDIQDHLIG